MSQQMKIKSEETSLLSEPTTKSARHTNGFGRLLVVSGVLMAVLLPIGVYPRILQSKELEAAQTKMMERLPEVIVIKAEAAPAARQITLPGSTEALLETGIFARTDGYVEKRFVDIGDRVTAGQLLATIETPEVDENAKESKAMFLNNVAAKAQAEATLDRAKADLITAQAELSQARANLLQAISNEKFAAVSSHRWGTLVKQGAVSAQDADEKLTSEQTTSAARTAAEQAVQSAESHVVAARALVEAQKASLTASSANIDAAKARENATIVKQKFQKVFAPFAGVITERNIDPGSLISSGSDSSRTDLFRLARIDTVRVFVDVPQYAAPGIKVGLPVEVNLKEFPGRTFRGEVKRTSVALNASARTLRTEIHIPNRDLVLAPGMYADVKFDIPNAVHSFIVPATALVSRGEGQQLALISGDAIHLQPVEVGHDLGNKLEIVGGITGKESIVGNPSDTLLNGTKVKIAEAPPSK